MSYLDRIRASYQAGRADTVRRRTLARYAADEDRAKEILDAKKAKPIAAVRRAGRIIESSRPIFSGAQQVAGSLAKLSQPSKPRSHKPRSHKIRSHKIRSQKPNKSLLW